MKTRTFISDSGTVVSTSSKEEIKMMKACCWKEVKNANQVFANGSTDGRRFL